MEDSDVWSDPMQTSCQAIVIPGEAPETDDEDESYDGAPSLTSVSRPDTTNATRFVGNRLDGANVTVKRSLSDFSVGRSKTITTLGPPKYNTLLHKKLRECQIALASHGREFYARQFAAIRKDVTAVNAGVQSVQQSMQEASFRMREVADTLYKVDAQLDAVLSCDTIPDLADLTTFPTLIKLSRTREPK